MANDSVAISSKPTVTTMNPASDKVYINVSGALKQILANDLLEELGSLLKASVPDRDAVDGLASLGIETLTDGEIRVVTDPGTIYVWDSGMTPTEAGDYWDTITPGNKTNPTTTNGFWYALGTKKPTVVAVTPVAGTATIDWDDNEIYTINNQEASGLTIAVTNVKDGAPPTKIIVTTNAKSLTAVTGLDSEGGTYNSAFAIMTLEIEKSNGRTYGKWIETAYGTA